MPFHIWAVCKDDWESSQYEIVTNISHMIKLFFLLFF